MHLNIIVTYFLVFLAYMIALFILTLLYKIYRYIIKIFNIIFNEKRSDNHNIGNFGNNIHSGSYSIDENKNSK